MQTSLDVRSKYETIQKQLFYMIPEKWDRVYLYACVVDHFNDLQTGEMFFYYFPKSMVRKNPVNVYEVPHKFNIDEKAYLRLAEKLYNEIKELRKACIKNGDKPWSNVTISVENLKFKVEYYYEDLTYTEYTSYDRHLIWRHQYLQIPLSSYSKKERNMLEEYLKRNQHNNKPNTYEEGIYKKPVSNITEFKKIDTDTKPEEVTTEFKIVNMHEQNNPAIEADFRMNRKPKKFKKQKIEIEEETEVKSQILTTK